MDSTVEFGLCLGPHIFRLVHGWQLKVLHGLAITAERDKRGLNGQKKKWKVNNKWQNWPKWHKANVWVRQLLRPRLARSPAEYSTPGTEVELVQIPCW